MAAPRLTPQQIETAARDLLARMTLNEKIEQMTGSTPLIPGLVTFMKAYLTKPVPTAANARLSIPGIGFTDGPRGIFINHSTCFPVAMARGASWDVELEERVGDAMGVEARALGATFSGGVCINLLRHPAWGRAQETFGEDPHHLGEMGAALVRGLQRHVMACAKHYACNSIENTRNKVNVRISERTLREVYLPHFKRCVDEGVASIMSAYNKVNGDYCGHNQHLLRDILKGEWGFQGFVMSDFVYGIYDAQAAAAAGVDVEMPCRWRYHGNLRKLIARGELAQDVIDEAALRIVRQKLHFAQIGEPERYARESVACPAHRDLAREAAQKAIVLLKNEARLLPIDLKRTPRIAIIGRLAGTANIGDHGSSMVRPPAVVTPLQGLQQAIQGKGRVTYDVHTSRPSAVEAARRADVAIVVAGHTYRDEGEKMPWVGGDRKSLRLAGHDEELIRAVAEANPHTVVVLMGGAPIICESWRQHVQAILMAWYPGMEGGHAIADVLLGKVNPSAKLPCVWPADERHLPPFDNRSHEVEYGYYHGYRLLDKNGHEPAFPFGFGLSYTTYSYSNLQIERDVVSPDGMLAASVDVTNTGAMAGDETVQLYVGYQGSAVDRPVKELKGFAKVALQPGETKTVRIAVPVRSLAYWDEAQARWIVEEIGYRVMVGPSAAETRSSAEFRVLRAEG